MLFTEVEAAIEECNGKTPDLRHNEQVNAFTIGNPFIEENLDLLNWEW